MTPHFIRTGNCARLLVAALFIGTLAGCAVPPPAPETEQPAVVEADPVVDEQEHRALDALSDRFEVVGVRMRAICVSPENRAYYNKTACLPSGITEAMLKDTSRITKAQKRAAEQVFNATHTLNEETRDLMLKSGIPSYMDEAIESRRTIDPAVKDLQNRLLSGKITWGEYNRERRDLAVRSAESHHE